MMQASHICLSLMQGKNLNIQLSMGKGGGAFRQHHPNMCNQMVVLWNHGSLQVEHKLEFE